jgi:hypothetical protein
MVGQCEGADEGSEVDRAAGEEAAEAGCARAVGDGPEGWYAIHGGMVAVIVAVWGGSWTNLDALAQVGASSCSVPVGTFAGW